MVKRGHGDTETRGHGDLLRRDTRVTSPPHRRVPGSSRPGVSASRRLPSLSFVLLLIGLALPGLDLSTLAQSKQTGQSGSHYNPARETLSTEDREMVERAIGVVCSERAQDPKGSIPIDEMQGRPSLPLYSQEAILGARRAERLLPAARDLVINSLRQLAAEYRMNRVQSYNVRIDQAIARVQMVNHVKPDMDSRDNASVFLTNPHTIVFGTIFLAGLPSDEGMISVLSHELVHIADGDKDGLRPLFRAVGGRASELTGLRIRNQRAEELACDLVGTMAARAYVSGSPNYEPLVRRLSRAIEHNCVDEDDSDEDHLSPRNTIRSLLALDKVLRREIINGR